MKGFKTCFSAAFAATAIMVSVQAVAKEPAGYYDRAEGLNKGRLLEALEEIVGDHDQLTYKNLWELFKESDVKDNGKIWDMYSTSNFTPGKDQAGNVNSQIGVNYNREHSMPKSWFHDEDPMYTDGFHLYPTDSRVNSQRSNYPFGECDGGTRLPDANGVHALGKVGTSTYSGYKGKVFEPDDLYKGDFARTYFYMAAAYNSRIEDWDSDQLGGTSYPCFSSWSVKMFMEWHRLDPVSEKELDRNEVIYEWQGNRNPFIDHPEMAEYVWGDMMDEGWVPGGSSSVEEVGADMEWNVYTTTDGELIVTVTEPCSVVVYTIDGQRAYSDEVDGCETIVLERGVYIVVCGTDARKVIVK